MGICHSYGHKKRQIITANQNNINTSNNPKELNGNLNNINLIITHSNQVLLSNNPAIITDANPQLKILTSPNEKHEKTPSTSSSKSTATRVYDHNSPKIFNIEATLGEIEIPIFVEKNENITININYNNNIQNIWSFLKKEQPIDYLGYPKYKYNDYNIGALLLRITGSQKIYNINNKIFSFKANSKGSLLFWANLNPNDYPIYEPKGFIQIIITGGNHIYENELNPPYDINKNYTKNNNYIIKEKKILKYINKARNNLPGFINDYFDINDNNEINQELKDYISKNNFIRKELINDNELNIIAQEHCEYLCTNGTNGEIGKDGIKSEDKIKKKLNVYYSKVNIIYGINNPLLIVKRMIQDKYSKSKKNRTNIFFHQLKKVGICLREHIAYKYCCVIAFSE